jgi:hypothetical protein
MFQLFGALICPPARARWFCPAWALPARGFFAHKSQSECVQRFPAADAIAWTAATRNLTGQPPRPLTAWLAENKGAFSG